MMISLCGGWVGGVDAGSDASTAPPAATAVVLVRGARAEVSGVYATVSNAFRRFTIVTEASSALLRVLMRLVILNDEVNAIVTPTGELLDQLCDVSGVLGALLVGSDGAVLGHALAPELLARAQAAARRLPLLLDAVSGGRGMQSYTLRFAEHRLYVRDLGGAVLALLTDLSCDDVLLKMTLNIAGKRLACLEHH